MTCTETYLEDFQSLRLRLILVYFTLTHTDLLYSKTHALSTLGPILDAI